MRRLNNNIVEFHLRLQKVQQVFSRSSAEEHIDIRHSKIGIDDEHAVPPALKGNCKVNGNVCLADAALSAGDRNDSYVHPGRCLCR